MWSNIYHYCKPQKYDKFCIFMEYLAISVGDIIYTIKQKLPEECIKIIIKQSLKALKDIHSYEKEELFVMLSKHLKYITVMVKSNYQI